MSGVCQNSVYFFVDDSGVLNKNAPCKDFIYAGYSFLSKIKMEDAKRRYRNMVHIVKNATHIDGEIKASKLKQKYKNKLFQVFKYEQSFSVAVDISKVYDHILGSKNSIHRYKDYVLKRIIKREILNYINKNIIDVKDDLKIHIHLDEQATATNGVYTLKESIYEELAEGISNYDYGTFHDPVMEGKVIVSVQYCDSSMNYLIQSADILANRIENSYYFGDQNLREIPNHLCLNMP